MKVVGLCASPRSQGNTQRLLRRFLDTCHALGAEVELLGAPEHRVDACQGCEQCMRQGTCPVEDDYLRLLPRILGADALVLASPNYAFDVSAQFKAVMDRSHAFLYYSQALRGKYGVGLCAAGHWAATRKVARRCAQMVWICGGNYVGAAWGISKHRDRKGFMGEKQTYARIDRLARKLVRAVQKRKQYRLQTWARETFVVSKLKNIFRRRRREYPWVAKQLLGD